MPIKFTLTCKMCIHNYVEINYTGELMSAVISFTRLHSEPNKNPPEFTLTCVSEGGPATTVMWWRDGEPVQEDCNHETSQIIVDTTANTVYNNTLTIKGREGGPYKCTVSNNIKSFVSYFRSSIVFTFRVEGKNLVRILVQHPHYTHCSCFLYIYSCRDTYSTHSHL